MRVQSSEGSERGGEREAVFHSAQFEVQGHHGATKESLDAENHPEPGCLLLSGRDATSDYIVTHLNALTP